MKTSKYNRLNNVGLAIAIASTALLLGSTTAPAADNYKVDAGHSSLILRSTHFGMGHVYGRFNEVSGSLKVDEKNPAKSSVEFQAMAASIDTNDKKRDKHLKGPDFLNAKQFPVITFKSKSVKKVNNDTFEVTGDLTLHGVTKSLTVQVKKIGAGKDPWGNHRLGVTTTFSVKRSDFGMKFMLEGVGDEVQLILSVEATRQ